MSQSTGRSDLLSLKRELLRSAQLDVQPLPASVRRQALLATTIAAATSATAGTATAASASATLGTATAASASATLGTATSVALALAKLGGIGALLVSVGTATYYATEGTWHPPRTISSKDRTPNAHTRQGAPVPVAEKSTDVASSIASASNNAASSSASASNNAASSSASESSASVPNGVVSSNAQTLSTSGSGHAANNNSETLHAADAPSPSQIKPSMGGVRAGGPAPLRAMPPEGAVAFTEPSPEQVLESQAQTRETLSKELALLDTARARLTAGDAGATLVQLDRYANEFPNGALQPEAMFLRVQALSRVGQPSSAIEIGRRFLTQYPTSPHADRVRALIESYSDDQNP